MVINMLDRKKIKYLDKIVSWIIPKIEINLGYALLRKISIINFVFNIICLYYFIVSDNNLLINLLFFFVALISYSEMFIRKNNRNISL